MHGYDGELLVEHVGTDPTCIGSKMTDLPDFFISLATRSVQPPNLPLKIWHDEGSLWAGDELMIWAGGEADSAVGSVTGITSLYGDRRLDQNFQSTDPSSGPTLKLAE
jgi:hypothetical protein